MKVDDPEWLRRSSGGGLEWVPNMEGTVLFLNRPDLFWGEVAEKGDSAPTLPAKIASLVLLRLQTAEVYLVCQFRKGQFGWSRHRKPGDKDAFSRYDPDRSEGIRRC